MTDHRCCRLCGGIKIGDSTLQTLGRMKLRLLFSYDDHLTPWNGELGSTVVFWCLLVVVFRVVVVPGLSWSRMPRSAVIPSTPLGSLDENQFASVTRQHLCNIEP